MFKAGTLPLNMKKTSDYPKSKVSFSPSTVEEAATSATTITTATPSTWHEVSAGQVVEGGGEV